MSYQFHRRLKMEHPFRRAIRVAIAWPVLFIVDAALWSMGQPWRDLREESWRNLQ